MKKLLLLLVSLFVLIPIPKPCPAADRVCPLIWDRVAGQTYTMTLDDRNFDVVFSPSYVGPCPQGSVSIYDGVYVAPVLECTYMSHGDNLVSVGCGDSEEIFFILLGDKLVVVDPNALYLVRRQRND
jgi:hypothetical protein